MFRHIRSCWSGKRLKSTSLSSRASAATRTSDRLWARTVHGCMIPRKKATSPTQGQWSGTSLEITSEAPPLPSAPPPPTPSTAHSTAPSMRNMSSRDMSPFCRISCVAMKYFVLQRTNISSRKRSLQSGEGRAEGEGGRAGGIQHLNTTFSTTKHASLD